MNKTEQVPYLEVAINAVIEHGVAAIFIFVAYLGVLFFKSKKGLEIRYFFYDYAHCWGRKCWKCRKRIWWKARGHTLPGTDEPVPYHAACYPAENTVLPGWIREQEEQRKQEEKMAYWREKGRRRAQDEDNRKSNNS